MRAALAFLTVVGGAAPQDRRAPLWFGPVGALVGLAVGSVWWGASEVWPPVVAAVVAVVADATITGMLHLDGLADAADGLLPPLPRQRRLAVMAAPDVGAFGVVALVTALVARVAALAALAPDPLLVAGLWAAARAAMAVTLARLPYARGSGGIATGFGATAPATGSEGSGPPPGAPPAGRRGTILAGSAAIAGGAVLVVATVGVVPGAATVVALATGFGAVVALACRRLGGYTGDVLGAAGVVGETLALLVAAARW
jgi:adenosylcobinamide-GDP ribazoletransferase